jgi:hypothetical protein
LPFALVVPCRRCSHCCPQQLDGSLFLISKHLCWMKGRLRARTFFMSRRNSSQSSGFEPLGGLSSSTLDGFLRSDVQFLQLPRLLSQFRSIDHEKKISSCIAQVATLWGTFENHSLVEQPRTLILSSLFGIRVLRLGQLHFAVISLTMWNVIFWFGMS